ncbi:MAG: NnrU family protein [Paracoccaceae bacterium]|nr:NnrU family protein [Paracoccaceae bacterium]
MTILILGLVLWTAAHFFKRLAPAGRQAMQHRMGDASKGIFAVLILLSVVLMVIGYRSYTGEFYWTRNAATVGINNLLMLLSVILFGLGSSKSRLRGSLRHPMLTGFILWGVAHLLVNGDTASFILFGGLILWAIAEIIVINRAEPEYERFEGGSIAGDVRLLIISAVVFTVISGVHIWLGYNPFGA